MVESAFGPERDPGVLGWSPMLGSLHGACFSLCLCLCLFLSVVSHEELNKIFKKTVSMKILEIIKSQC